MRTLLALLALTLTAQAQTVNPPNPPPFTPTTETVSAGNWSTTQTTFTDAQSGPGWSGMGEVRTLQINGSTLTVLPGGSLDADYLNLTNGGSITGP